MKKRKEKPTVPLAYSNILRKTHNQIQFVQHTDHIWYDHRAIFFSRTIKAFSSEDQLDNQSIPFQKSLLFLAKKQTNKSTWRKCEKKRKKKETNQNLSVSLPSIPYRHCEAFPKLYVQLRATVLSTWRSTWLQLSVEYNLRPPVDSEACTCLKKCQAPSILRST